MKRYKVWLEEFGRFVEVVRADEHDLIAETAVKTETRLKEVCESQIAATRECDALAERAARLASIPGGTMIDAPSHYRSEEASAWASGYAAGVSACRSAVQETKDA